MFEDNISDYQTSATLIVTQTTFDKRALCTNDLSALAISLSNMHYLSVNFPVRLASLLTSNGCLELVIRKARQGQKTQQLIQGGSPLSQMKKLKFLFLLLFHVWPLSQLAETLNFDVGSFRLTWYVFSHAEILSNTCRYHVCCLFFILLALC
jgi:hypothetical protein